MPPARSRPALDDSRSESSTTVTNLKEKAHIGSGVSKSRKAAAGHGNDTNAILKAAAVTGALAAAAAETATPNGSVQAAVGPLQTDWNEIPLSTLYTYRAAYGIQTPSSYTHDHADLIYKSSNIGLRAPSQVLARKKMHELRKHRQRLAEANGKGHLNGTSTTNGLHKLSKHKQANGDDNTSEVSSRSSRKKRKDNNHVEDNTVISKSINGVSNRNHPSAAIAQSIEQASPTIRSADSVSDSHAHSQPETYIPSSLLDSRDPESTLIGLQSPTSLRTTIRKHFNAQQSHEMDTLSKFSYVAKQSGYGLISTASAPFLITGNNKDHDKEKDKDGGGGAALRRKALEGVSQPIRIEGSDGDGNGWIMGSMGREVRMNDIGGGGAFRLRFRPQV